MTRAVVALARARVLVLVLARVLVLASGAVAIASGSPAATCAQDLGAIAPPTPALDPLPPMTGLPSIGGGPPLALDDVIASIDAHHPAIAAAEARVVGAAGSVVSAEGGFDPAVAATGWIAPYGYYQYGRADVSITQATPLWGASLIAGWRIGRPLEGSSIPLYYGYLDTLDAGEVRGGITIPLWRDGPIDARRAGIARAEQGVAAAERDLDARSLRTRLAGAEAYYRWVAAGRKVEVALALLRIAEERDVQIASRVAAGAVPAFEHLENRRAIFERRQAAVAARRGLERAALQLSLYLRDEGGAPRIAPPSRVPERVAIPPLPAGDEEALVARALDSRPELARFRALASAARVQLELAENQIAPRIDLGALASVDLGGSPAESWPLQRQQDPVFETWVTLQLPLGMREARGRADAARAEVHALEADAELQADQIRIEVRDALSTWRAARESLELATESARVAEQVAHGERTRFANGATTMLVVNLREAAAAQARAAVADAEADLATARFWIDVAVPRPPSRASSSSARTTELARADEPAAD